MGDLDELRERVQIWRLLARQMTDARVVEALVAEITQLKEKIGRLEATKSSDPAQPRD